MLLKKAKYKKVKSWKNKCISNDVYGCDECKSTIKEFPKEYNKLEMTVFYNEKETERLQFCSWSCVLKYIPKLNSDNFVTLPYIYFNGKRGIKELIKSLK